MKNVFTKKTCATVVCTFLLVLSSSFSYGNNTKQRFDPLSDAVFDIILDNNGDGFFDENELSIFTNFPVGGLTEFAMEGLVERLDTDGDGKINRAEFATVGSLIALRNLVTDIFNDL